MQNLAQQYHKIAMEANGLKKAYGVILENAKAEAQKGLRYYNHYITLKDGSEWGSELVSILREDGFTISTFEETYNRQFKIFIGW